MTQEPLEPDLREQIRKPKYKLNPEPPFRTEGDVLMVVFYVLIPLALLYVFLRKHNLV